MHETWMVALDPSLLAGTCGRENSKEATDVLGTCVQHTSPAWGPWPRWLLPAWLCPGVDHPLPPKGELALPWHTHPRSQGPGWRSSLLITRTHRPQ